MKPGITSASFSLLILAFIFIMVFQISNTESVLPTATYTFQPAPIPDDSLEIRKAFSDSPVLSPQESMQHMQLEEGFTVELIAAEPWVNSPVALAFDAQGRMWVAEMQSYMPDTAGTGEEQATGKIVILEDKNKDGLIDSRKVFLDSLVLPRALSFIENGILIAEPPKLWFVEIENDLPGKKIVVDENYTEGGNVEHEPNGLLRALDNWIYNAKSSKRYRKQGNSWVIEKTHFRGQWGISQDDYGRLYYNNNSQNLLGDYFSPGFGATNPHQQRVAGYNENIVPDNRVYPLRPTMGVNRGYLAGILDEKLRLVNFTAASSPLIYRGNLYDSSYYQNAFVAEPAANLIKRNILTQIGYRVEGKQAYEGTEFLRSADERFRPVSLYNGPDGAMYVVDMYRGIIQHEYFLTNYLANEIDKRNLAQPISCGRIYKIVPVGQKNKPVVFSDNPHQQAILLQHPNGWVRDKAQQLLIDRHAMEVVPVLRQNLTKLSNPLPVIHSLWTLEGLGALQAKDVQPLLTASSWPIRMQALTVLTSVINQNNYTQFIPVLEKLLYQQDTLAAPYIAFLAHTIEQFNKPAASKLLQLAAKTYPNNLYVSDAIISNLQNREEKFFKAIPSDTSMALHKQANKVLRDIAEAKESKSLAVLEKKYPKGASLFKTTCQPCHGPDGNGIKSLAPPLNNSNWVVGPKSKLIPIILYGLTGPIMVSGKLYKSPEINGDMPGIGHNKELSDEEVAELITFIRNSWNNDASKIKAKDITEVREKYKGRQKSFTMDELNNL